MNIYLMNGPPRAGKDLAGRMLGQMLPGKNRILKFASILKVATHAVAAIMAGGKQMAPPDHYENVKDDRHPDFFGAKPREAYILMSEDFCKAAFGKRIFGIALLEQIKKLLEDEENAPDNLIITDCGFKEEIEVLVKALGEDHEFHLIRMHRDGCNFDTDSRSYLHGEDVGVKTANDWNIHNPGTLGKLRVAVAEYLLHDEEAKQDGC